MGELDLGIEGFRGFQEIESGGFADVYVASDEFGRRVAVKVLKSLDGRGRRRFDRERSVLGQVAGHAHIVTPFTSGYTTVDAKPYLVMEYLGGGSLQDRIDRHGPCPIVVSIDLVVPIAHALGASHGAGVIHRDLKPANILLTDEGVPKLADFGISSIRDATQTTSVAYSPEYTPPELFHSSGTAADDPRDERSDLYGLAATLYALVSGTGPFESETNTSLAATMARILNEPTPSVGHPDLDAFLATAMAKSPNDRYACAEHFIEALLDVRRRVVGDNRPVAQTRSSPRVGPPTPRPLLPPAPQPVASMASQPVAPPTAVPPPPQRPDHLLDDHLADDHLFDDDLVDRRLTLPMAIALGVGAAVVGVIGQLLLSGFGGSDPRTVAIHVGHTDSVLALVETDDQQIASAGRDGSVQVWDPDGEGPMVTYTRHSDAVWAVTELGDGRLASGGADRIIRTWDRADPERTVGSHPSDSDVVWDIAQLSNGQIVSGGGGGTIEIWPLDDPSTTTATYTRHQRRVLSIRPLADGRIASASADGTVHVWHPDDLQASPVVYRGHRGEVLDVIELSSGRLASAGSDATVQVWDPDDPELTIATYGGHNDAVWAVAELDDGRLASAGSDGTVQIWAIEDPDVTLLTYAEHGDTVWAVVELADGRLASAGADATVRVWER